eukprot:TRINITY_DN3278_c0_g1_i1.p1 TRINITY_DN3278_c0_g1~~TRINITY_DN3278_c0_g1_i1.p1  ORF type:complete len:455 (+),score=139.52 TRINITY_DN3278_c0_g1_i1:23-1366(+)
MTQTEFVFHQPTVQPELRQSEAYWQVFDALDNLNRSVDEVFTRINQRVTHEKGRLQSLGARLDVAQSKVKQIQSSNRAITVLSPSKYPAPESVSNYVPLYADAETKPNKRSPYKLSDIPHSTSELVVGSIDAALLLKETNNLVDTDASNEGLGRLPIHLPSISNLLLFNTQENPYKKYASINNLAGKEAIKKDDKKAKVELTEAPKTFTQAHELPALAALEYNYRPALGEVPEFKFTSALPLANVSELGWNVAVQSIAPSGNQNLPPLNLPSVDASSTASASSASAPPPPPPASASAPPPPPPPSNLPSFSAAPEEDVGGPPPPPPPGPPPPPPMSGPSGDAPAGIPAAVKSDSRSSLMESIRLGKSLKKASDRKVKEPKTKKGGKSGGNSKPPPANPGADMFGDLIMALNRRRKGIAEKERETSRKTEEDDTSFDVPKSVDADWEP